MKVFFKKFYSFFPCSQHQLFFNKNERKSGVQKYKLLFNWQGVWKFFLKNSTPFFLAPDTCYFSIKWVWIGRAKIKTLFDFSKSFWCFFTSFLTCLPCIISMDFFAIAGAKITLLFASANPFVPFFYNVLLKLYNPLIENVL